METTFKKKSRLALSEKTKEVLIDLICYIFIALFLYTASSKLMSFDSFKDVLSKSPLIANYNVVIAWAIPLTEIGISILLLIPFTKLRGLYFSILLMIVFTIYLIYMILSGSQLPCHCGGVISSMSWKEHIIFNFGFIALAIMGLALYKNLRAWNR